MVFDSETEDPTCNSIEIVRKYIEEKASLEKEIADINKDSENIVETIKTLRENGNNISGRVVSIRNEIYQRRINLSISHKFPLIDIDSDLSV